MVTLLIFKFNNIYNQFGGVGGGVKGGGDDTCSNSNTIRLRRQSMSDMSSDNNKQHYHHHASGNDGSASNNGGLCNSSTCSMSMSVAERILRMETFLSKTQPQAAPQSHNNNNNNNGSNGGSKNNLSLGRRNSTNIQSPSNQSTITTSSTSTSTSTTIINNTNQDSNQSLMLEPSQKICKNNDDDDDDAASNLQQNGGETTTLSSTCTSNHHSINLLNTTTTNISNKIIMSSSSSSSHEHEHEHESNNSIVVISNGGSDGAPSDSDGVNTRIDIEDGSGSGNNSETQLECHSFDSGCIDDDNQQQQSHQQQSHINDDNNMLTTPTTLSLIQQQQQSNNVITTTKQDDEQQQQQTKTHSVQSRAAIFNQQQSQQQQQQSILLSNTCGNKKKDVAYGGGGGRYKHRRAAAVSSPGGGGGASSRFSTQPITYDEIQEANKQKNTKTNTGGDHNNDNDNVNDNDDKDPSKLSLAERIKLFNEKMKMQGGGGGAGGKGNGNQTIVATTTTTVGGDSNVYKCTTASASSSATHYRNKRYKSNRYQTLPVTSNELLELKQQQQQQQQQHNTINPLIASFVKPPSSQQLAGLSIKQTKAKINEHAIKMLTTTTTTTTTTANNNTNVITNTNTKSNTNDVTTTTTPGSGSGSGSVAAVTPVASIRTMNNEHHPSTRSVSSVVVVGVGDGVRVGGDSVVNANSEFKVSTITSSSSSEGEQSSGEREIRSIISSSSSSIMKHKQQQQQPKQYSGGGVHGGTTSTCDNKIKCGNETTYLKKINSNNTTTTTTTDIDTIIKQQQLKINTTNINNNNNNKNDNGGGRKGIIKSETSSTARIDDVDKSDELEKQSSSSIIINNNKMSTPTAVADVNDVKGQVEVEVDEDDDNDNDNDVVDNTTIINNNKRSIAERLTALQHAGQNDWKRRIPPIDIEYKVNKTNTTTNTTTNTNTISISTSISHSNQHESTTTIKQHKDNDNDTSSSTSTSIVSSSSSVLLADRVNKLETASQGWKKRVEQNDAINFTVAGRMLRRSHGNESTSTSTSLSISPSLPNIPINSSTTINSSSGSTTETSSGTNFNKAKKIPKPARFKTKQERLETKSTSTSTSLTRSISVPNNNITANNGNGDHHGIENGLLAHEHERVERVRVTIPRADDDETFTSFFNTKTTTTTATSLTSLSSSSLNNDNDNDNDNVTLITLDDLDTITNRMEPNELLTSGYKRQLQLHKRKYKSSYKNPIKYLQLQQQQSNCNDNDHDNDALCIQQYYIEHKQQQQQPKQQQQHDIKINTEKIATKNSNMAIAALAGLASKEDFTAINLKKTNMTTNSSAAASITTFSMLPLHGTHGDNNDDHLMLIHIKGRRHVQVRLVEPVLSSINNGDNYILLTKTHLYNYQGIYSNIIEQSRANEIAQTLSLSSNTNNNNNNTNGNKQIITIRDDDTTNTQHVEAFYKLLKRYDNNDNDNDNESTSSNSIIITDAGHPDEDEIYESKIIETNMMYELIIDNDNDELILSPYDKYWGCIPKIDMLDPNKIFIFDFGTEMYVWNGKNSSLDRRKIAVKLAKELWEQGYDYTDCDICPINATQLLGSNRIHPPNPIEKKSNTRPKWALLAKVTQNMEPILFREKFLDWPDYSRLIKVKTDEKSTPTTPGGAEDAKTNIIIKPLETLKLNACVPDLILEGSHLGRGTHYYDPETNRNFEISTLSVKKWYIQEFEYFELDTTELNHFYSTDSYILRWQYMITVTGRELSGKPSRHSMAGRDRCAYFCWQGKDASLNEKGAAALLTVELDHERGPQVRVTQGYEPPAFLTLFNGSMIVHSNDGKEEQEDQATWRLYLCRGDLPNEVFLTEVACNQRQLRSRASMVLVNLVQNHVVIWHGSKSLEHTRKMARSAVEKLKGNTSKLFKLQPKRVEEVEEGSETDEVLNALGIVGGRRELYMSLLNDSTTYTQTPRLFQFSSVSGVFEAAEVQCSYRCASSSEAEAEEIVTPYPFSQSDLYTASQPTLFLLDNGGHTLWLWQGWWPDQSGENESHHYYLSDQTGSGAIRWQEERRAAMQTTINYWRQNYGHHLQDTDADTDSDDERKGNEKSDSDEAADADSVRSGSGSDANAGVLVLVWAGLEPIEFTNLFPTWIDRDDIAEINMRDGHKPGDMISLNNELERLTCCTYPSEVLLQRPLPDGVDPTRLQEYLSPKHFKQLFNGLTKQQFHLLPKWKQRHLKQQIGLF